MRIAVISDVHDNIWALGEVLSRIQDCETLLCLGDMCAPFVYGQIGKDFPGQVHCVWGNNDGDRLLIVRQAATAGQVALHGDYAELQLGGRAVAMLHYPQMARPAAMSGLYDLVCCGHDHTRNISWVGKTLLLNPGEVMGRFGVRSYAVYDTVRGEAELLALP